ncbi:MAG: glycosyltransferase family A protein [Candidatus Paceibacterota bacterium]
MKDTAESPKLSISLIIPAYNEEAYLGACLEAVQENSNGKFNEIIVVNNNSTDKTAEIAARFPGVRVICEKKKGLVHARQCGFENAQGSILAYIDADTLMPKGWPEQIEEYFSADPELACLSGPYKYYDIPARHQFVVSFWYWMARPTYYVLGYMATGGNIALRKSVVEKMNGFDTSIAFYGEDTDIAKRAHSFGKVVFTSKFIMPTSARRFKKEGLFKIGGTYLVNFLSTALVGRPINQRYTDVR